MAESFPGSLQDKMNSSGFGLQFGEVAITSDNEIGPPKKRARFTDPIDTYTCSIDCDFSDYITIKNFYFTTLGGGVKKFNYNHPFTGELLEFGFVDPPSMSPLGSGGTKFRVSMSWRQY